MDGRTQYSNFKVKKETVSVLQDAKKAVQALAGGKEITNDEFVMEIVGMATVGNESFDKLYKKVLKDNQDLLKLAEEETKNRI